MVEFLQTPTGEDYLKSFNLFYDVKNARLKFMRISVQSVGDSADSRKDKMPLRDSWDAFVNNFSQNKAPKGLKNVY